MEKLSYKMDSCLETIYELHVDGYDTTVDNIAKKMLVTKATVRNIIEQLKNKGLVISQSPNKIILTAEGFQKAELADKKHKIIHCFLVTVLNVNPTIANEDACLMEHMISNDTVNAMTEFMSRVNKNNFKKSEDKRTAIL